jgi:NAD(P)-dependent dehydrogenase (short-subunit alcohol dehydrogenase family)
MRRLAGKVAIVTGAGQGIGWGIARVFAHEGARVCAADLKGHRAERTASEIREAGGEAMSSIVDGGRRADVEAMVAEVVRRWKTVDVLVNNAHAFGRHRPLAEIADADFDRSWVSGVKGSWWAMCAVKPYMERAGWGRIVNFGSLAAEHGHLGLGDYVTAKGGIAALTRAAAREWGPLGITVNLICPAAASKRGLDFQERDPERFAATMARRPIGRLGDLEADIAPVALFVASDESRFLTGQVFYADGGAHLG